jgi:hypothetical protein
MEIGNVQKQKRNMIPPHFTQNVETCHHGSILLWDKDYIQKVHWEPEIGSRQQSP